MCLERHTNVLCMCVFLFRVNMFGLGMGASCQPYLNHTYSRTSVHEDGWENQENLSVI